MDPARLDAAVAIIRSGVPEVSAIYLYGSFARGDSRPDSDVDLAFITTGAAPSGLALWNLWGDLVGAVGLPIDLVDLDHVSTVLQWEVIRDGVRLFVSDACLLDRFELRVLREYADLKMRRAGIDADIVARGRVLGHV